MFGNLVSQKPLAVEWNGPKFAPRRYLLGVRRVLLTVKCLKSVWGQCISNVWQDYIVTSATSLLKWWLYGCLLKPKLFLSGKLPNRSSRPLGLLCWSSHHHMFCEPSPSLKQAEIQCTPSVCCIPKSTGTLFYSAVFTISERKKI